MFVTGDRPRRSGRQRRDDGLEPVALTDEVGQVLLSDGLAVPGEGVPLDDVLERRQLLPEVVDAVPERTWRRLLARLSTRRLRLRGRVSLPVDADHGVWTSTSW